MKVASFFAGIGGFDLGFERAGMRVVFQCEIDGFAKLVLKKHWPEVPLHEDITKLKSTDIPPADLWCAGWPCQDLSHANAQRKGLSGERSGLFYTFMDLVAESTPKWIVMENVSGLLSAEQGTALEAVVDTIEANGYLGGWFTFNAISAGLPQNRERIFFVASYRCESAYKFFFDGCKLFGDFEERKTCRERIGSNIRAGAQGNDPLVVQRRGGFGYTSADSICPTLRAQTGKHQGGHSDRPILCGEKFDLERVRENNGLPRRLDGRRGRLIGNAVVPQIAEWIGKKIMKIEGQLIENGE